MALILRLLVNREPGPTCTADEEIRIGRSSSMELRLDRSGVSRRHARIYEGGGRFWVEDLGSSNGTRLNGRTLRAAARLQHRDRIQIGDTALEVDLAAGGASSRPLLRPSRLLAGVAVLAAVVAGAHLVGGRTAQAEIAPDAGGRIFDLDQMEEGEVFGAGQNADHRISERLVFRFSLAEGIIGENRISLRYGAASVPEYGVEIQLNGRAIGFSEPAPGSWRYGVERTLPGDLLLPGQPNQIAFVASYGASEDWLIRDPELLIEPIPPCAPAACVEQAEHLHAIGLRRFEAQALIPSNLFEAWSSFREAGLFLVPLASRSPLHDRIDELSARTWSALDQRCSQLRFTVLRSVALGDELEARRAANEILRSFPRDGHRCHREGKYLLDLLGG